MKNKYKERLEIKTVDAIPLFGIIPMTIRNWEVIREVFKREYNFEFNKTNSRELVAYMVYQQIFSTVFPLIIYRGLEDILK